MKKPNITPGEWRIGNYRPYRQVVQIVDPSLDNDSRTGKRQICTVNDNGNQKENAQAISAVPDLLKEAYATYLTFLAHPQYRVEGDIEFQDRVDGLHDALTKAGYEL